MEQIHPRAEQSAASRLVPSRSYSARHKQIASLSDNNGNRAFNLLSYLFHCCRIPDSLLPTSVFYARSRRSRFSPFRVLHLPRMRLLHHGRRLLINAVRKSSTSDVFLPLVSANEKHSRKIAKSRRVATRHLDRVEDRRETRKPQGR